MQIPNDLLLSVSGLRGKVDGSFNIDVVRIFAAAFHYISPPGQIIVSRDSRPTGKQFKTEVIKILTGLGRDVMDADLIPLPTTQVAVEETKAAGAIDITASHNPVEYNGLKFLGPDGMFLRQEKVDLLKTKVEELEIDKLDLDQAGKITDIQDQAKQWHLEKLEKYFVSGQNLKVAVDAVNGAGSEIVPSLLEKMGCTTIAIAVKADDPFPHTPEPLPANLIWTQEQLKGKTFDLCVVVDPDADRLVLIDENGRLLPEETTIPLIAMELMEQGRKGKIVINLSTSRMTEDVAEKYGCTVVRSKVGEINVVEKMKATEAFFGGEGGGGIIDPEIHYGRDSLVGITYIVDLMRRTNKKLSQLADELPHYEMAKIKIPRNVSLDLKEIYRKTEQAFEGFEANYDDGLRLSQAKKWIHIRPSNTEPILRIIAEAPTRKEVDELAAQAESVLK